MLQIPSENITLLLLREKTLATFGIKEPNVV